MDFNAANFKKINQFNAEARRWNPGGKKENPPAAGKGRKVQPAKRKKKGKA